MVDLSSTYACTQPVSKVKRWNKKEKTLVDMSYPAIVKEYNKYMGGVDLAGMLRALYRIEHRIVNGWLQYKRDLKTSEAASGSQKDLMQFTLDVSEALTKVNKAYLRKSRGRMSLTTNVETSRRRQGRSTHISITYDNHSLTVVKLYDSRAMAMSSTFVRVEPIKTKRYIEVPSSAVVDDCNKSVGDVDVSNLLTGLY
ncbi:hypothetical protein T10_2640 [Trichinella papuae]|uniref:PiggyBac transposable element-derived protein 3 n=1 Tax=Trichinella papuae TaxID=268474 RepID=A0A0V1MUS5_9BILA|nr:hypothetical protein T10_2640 [Trichinella papuae]